MHAPDELLTIIVPVYNEVATIRAVIERLLAIELPLAREIVVVDDGSTDGTREVLAAAVREQLPLIVLEAERNGGKGSAIRRGLAHARGTIIAIQDADLELDPAQLALLVEPILKGETNVTYGSRFLAGASGAPWLTRVANRVLTAVTNVLFGSALTDMETCYKVIRTSVARSLHLTANRFDIEPEITARLLRHGHVIHELPIRFEPRTRAQGKKIGWRDGVRALHVLVGERLRRPPAGAPDRADSAARSRSGKGRLRRFVAAAVFYTLLAVVATWPLVARMGSAIASDPGDPILNTSVLIWNATALPLSPAWYNAPHFYPTEGATTLTENLLGVYPIASPIYWLSGNALLAYNLTLFLTWPFAALAVFLLVRQLTARDDAALVAGLAFAFTPYRAVALPHLQTLTTFGVALIALGMHGYRADGRRRWLVVLAVAWLHQGFANGYYILYGALFVAVWTLYFCSTRAGWRAVVPFGTAIALGSLPLLPMLLTYRRVHNELGMRRSLEEILYFSASPASWLEVGELSWLWSGVLKHGKDNLFPGAVVLVLSAAGVAISLRRSRLTVPSPGQRPLRTVLALVCGVAVASMLAQFTYGPVDTTVFGIPLKMRSLDRSIAALILAGGWLVWMTPHLRAALVRRSALVFYAGAAVLFGLLACGPDLRVSGQSILNPTPYGLLMYLPGFDELRVPTQIKMIHLLCLCVAAGLGWSVLVSRAVRFRPALLAAVCAAVLADGWLIEIPTADAPGLWPVAEPADRAEPILELPLGPEWDSGATLRAAVHHRRVMNGVSGYDPPYYYALNEGLAGKDPRLLEAIASLGAFDIVVNHEADADGASERYAAAAAGGRAARGDGVRRVFHVPRMPGPVSPGARLQIVAIQARDNPADASTAIDGRAGTGWGVFPQEPGQWVIADLGRVVDVGGVTHAIGNFKMDFPRLLSIELSDDGESWVPVWTGTTYAETFLAFVRSPGDAVLQFFFDARPARYVRLRQLGSFPRAWWLSELGVHAP